MAEPIGGPIMLGVFIDCTGAAALDGMRVCIVERTRLGKVTMRAAGDDYVVKAVIDTMTAAELARMVDMLHGTRNEAAS